MKFLDNLLARLGFVTGRRPHNPALDRELKAAWGTAEALAKARRHPGWSELDQRILQPRFRKPTMEETLGMANAAAQPGFDAGYPTLITEGNHPNDDLSIFGPIMAPRWDAWMQSQLAAGRPAVGYQRPWGLAYMDAQYADWDPYHWYSLDELLP